MGYVVMIYERRRVFLAGGPFVSFLFNVMWLDVRKILRLAMSNMCIVPEGMKSSDGHLLELGATLGSEPK